MTRRTDETKNVYVLYHTRKWEILVAAGWVTWAVVNGIAMMVRGGTPE